MQNAVRHYRVAIRYVLEMTWRASRARRSWVERANLYRKFALSENNVKFTSNKTVIGSCYYIICVSISLLLYTGFHFHGMPIIPECGDGWAYWQGAISISDGLGYRDFSGAPILFWPPAYSTYLASWTALFGPTALAMVLGNAFLVAVQAVLWYHFFSLAGARPSAAVKTLIAVYIGLFVPLNHQSIYAHNLLDTLLPGLLISVWMFISAKDSRAGIKWVALTAILGTLCLLAHNSAVAFVFAAATVAVVMGSGGILVRVVAGFVITALPLVIWSVVRSVMGHVRESSGLFHSERIPRSIGPRTGQFDHIRPPALAGTRHCLAYVLHGGSYILIK
jgi:hypothetical protein